MKIKFMAIFFTVGLLALLPGAYAQVEKPNVVIIFMDDMGYGDLESYGGMGYKTPQINKMAAEGMRFTHFYVSQPVCSASRAALLTGCYSNRVGILGALMPWAPIALHQREQTLAEVLKEQGYRTGMVGKWHLGDKKPHLPLQHGFDEFFGLPYSNDMWPMGYDAKPAGPEYKTIKPNKLRHPPLPLLEGNKKIKTINDLDDQSELTTLYTERATSFITRNRRDPFLLYVAHSMPHVPLAVSKKFRGKSDDGIYGDVMMELDWSVGEILKTLDDLNLSNNTLVIMTSDNGPWLTFGNHGGNSGGLREGKGTAWEGGMRVPCIMRWKGVIPEGTICSKTAATIDVLPTVAQISGAKLPAHKIDGVNILSLLKNEKDATPREHFAFYRGNRLEAVRKGQWKLVFPHVYHTNEKGTRGFDGWPGKQPLDSAEFALYNLRIDPGENINLKEKFPEQVKQLVALAEQYRNDLGDAYTRQKGSGRRAPAKVKRDQDD
jgi:arylsulfatase A-like enzyme